MKGIEKKDIVASTWPFLLSIIFSVFGYGNEFKKLFPTPLTPESFASYVTVMICGILAVRLNMRGQKEVAEYFSHFLLYGAIASILSLVTRFLQNSGIHGWPVTLAYNSSSLYLTISFFIVAIDAIRFGLEH